MHRLVPALLLCASTSAFSQLATAVPAALPEAPSQLLVASVANPTPLASSPTNPFDFTFYPVRYSTSDNADAESGDDQDLPLAPMPAKTEAQKTQDAKAGDHALGPAKHDPHLELDAAGNPIPLNRQQPQRILGFMPNFRSVSGGSKPHPPGWKYNFKVATRQSFDYSSFIFLGITSLSAEGINSHPKLGKGVGGAWAYSWRGFLDKTDGTYLGAWLLPSLLHEDTRYYALGSGHKVPTRFLYIVSRQVVTRTYGGHQTPNIAGFGGKILTQVISRNYYPAGTSDFSVLATKFGYAAMRDVIFTSIREFYPDIAAHYIRKHRAKVAALSARDTQPPASN